MVEEANGHVNMSGEDGHFRAATKSLSHSVYVEFKTYRRGPASEEPRRIFGEKQANVFKRGVFP